MCGRRVSRRRVGERGGQFVREAVDKTWAGKNAAAVGDVGELTGGEGVRVWESVQSCGPVCINGQDGGEPVRRAACYFSVGAVRGTWVFG